MKCDDAFNINLTRDIIDKLYNLASFEPATIKWELYYADGRPELTFEAMMGVCANNVNAEKMSKKQG